jgi:hypothetical protein
MLNASGAFEACQDTIHTRTPAITSRGPNRLAGRRLHQ